MSNDPNLPSNYPNLPSNYLNLPPRYPNLTYFANPPKIPLNSIVLFHGGGVGELLNRLCSRRSTLRLSIRYSDRRI